MKVDFKILRQNSKKEQKFQTYTLEVETSNTILECLNKIKWELDGSLAFRKNCRNTICGSCGLKINGKSALACKENIATELSRLSFNKDKKNPEIVISPLGNMPVIKDLVTDMSEFWNNLEKIEPYVSSKSRNIAEKEFLQTPQERQKLDQTGNCIMCGACYSECTSKEVNFNFVGPHALAKSYRMMADSRDINLEKRLEKSNNMESGVWGCTRCYLCNEVCPMDVQPLDQISKIKSEILARNDQNSSRPIRHRKVLIDLVKNDGWIDERKFGVMVVGNYLRDLKGIISIMPLGLRLLASGKFPIFFEPSEGVTEVRSLINAIQDSDQ